MWAVTMPFSKPGQSSVSRVGIMWNRVLNFSISSRNSTALWSLNPAMR